MLWDLVLVTANIVTMESLQKEEIFKDDNKQLEHNYYEFEKVFIPFEKKFTKIEKENPNVYKLLKSFDYNNKDAAQILESTKTERDEILKILSTKIISIPSPEFSDKESYTENVNQIVAISKISRIKTFYKYELLDIKRNLYMGDKKVAVSRYITLWKSIDNLYKSENDSLINYMIKIACSGILQEFYFDNQQMMDNNNIVDLSETLLSIDKNIDSSFQYSLKGEYVCMKELLKAVGTQAKWPFFDYNKTVNTFYRDYKTTIDMCNKPYYALDKSSENTVNVDENNSILSNLINPIGTQLFEVLSLSSPKSMMEQKEIFKSKIRAMYFVINKGTNVEMPTDNLTGKKFIIKDYKGYYEISSQLKLDGKSAFTYKVIKK